MLEAAGRRVRSLERRSLSSLSLVSVVVSQRAGMEHKYLYRFQLKKKRSSIISQPRIIVIEERDYSENE